MLFSHRAHALVFNYNDPPLGCVCSAVNSNADGEETQAEAAGGAGCGGEGAGAAGDGVSEGAVLRRTRGGRRRGPRLLPARRSPAPPPPQEEGAAAAAGGRQGQHPDVPEGVAPHRAGGRGLQAVYHGQDDGGRSGSSRPPVRLPQGLRPRGVGVPRRLPELPELPELPGVGCL